MLTATLVIGCSKAENKNATVKPTVLPTQTTASAVSTSASLTATPLVSNAVAPRTPRNKQLPPVGGDKPTEAEVNGYPYTYKTDNEKTVATFAPKLLPSERDIVARAIRDVIYRSYGEKVDADPHMVGTGSAQSIRIAGSKHQYLVVPTNETTGEIHSLIITRLN